MKNAVKEWIENPLRDYFDGVRLLECFGNNQNLVRVFQNRSPRFAMNDLVSEVRRLGDVMVPEEEHAPILQEQEKRKEIPSVVEKAKKLVHDYWVKLSKNHNALYNVGESNDTEAKERRVKLMNERNPWIERYNSIYTAKEMFFQGTLSEQQLKEVVDGMTIEDILQPKKHEEKKSLSELSDLTVAKMAKAAKSAINRYKNQLLYRQDTAAKVENPMPQCPKRKELEKKMDERMKELAVLEAELKSR